MAFFSTIPFYFLETSKQCTNNNEIQMEIYSFNRSSIMQIRNQINNQDTEIFFFKSVNRKNMKKMQESCWD